MGLKTLPSSCAKRLEIWKPHFPGTLTACTGIALSLHTFMCVLVLKSEQCEARISGANLELSLLTGFSAYFS